MKIIQSFWSLPSKVNLPTDNFGRNNGGWLEEKYHAMSWALSCLKFRQYYQDVELYTDYEGYDWLINKLDLPYTNVFNSLNGLSYQPSLWALSKLATIMLQKEPFLHVDSDVYIWKAFNEGFINSRLFVQNIEYELQNNGHGHLYFDTVKMLEKKSAFMPHFIKNAITNFKQSNRIDAYNTGIVGGYDTEFFYAFGKIVFDFLEKNQAINFSGKDMNFVEQFFLFCFAKQCDIDCSILLPEENVMSAKSYTTMSQFNLVPILKNYIHVVGGAKRQLILCKQIEMRLKYEYPSMYHHITTIYKKIDYHSVKVQTSSSRQSYFKETSWFLKKFGIVSENNNLEELSQSVDRALGSYDQLLDKKRLSDVFQIEKFALVSASTQFDENNHKKKVLDMLYTATPTTFLKQKFTLNINKIGIICVNFRYPRTIQLTKLENLFTENIEESDPDLMLIIKRSNEEVQIKEFDDSEILLSCFDEREIDGYQFINYIKSNSLLTKIGQENTISFAISFIAKHSLYFNNLTITQ